MVRVAISIGHSNLDSGAIGVDGTKEHDLNVALVNEILLLPIPQFLEWIQTDQDAEDLPYPQHLIETIKAVNKSDAVCCLEIHHNSVSNNKVKRAEIIYWDSSIYGYELGKKVRDHMMGVRQDVRLYPCQKHLQKKLGFLYRTNIPAIIIEPTYMSNMDDLMMAKTKKKEFAIAIKDGVIDWLKSTGKI